MGEKNLIDHVRDHYEGQGLSAARRRYYANISRLDARVGEVLAHLEQRGLREGAILTTAFGPGFSAEALHLEAGVPGEKDLACAARS